MIGGIKIISEPLAYSTKWVFPKERFVEYEPKDESWCRYFGFGREEGPQAYQLVNRCPIFGTVTHMIVAHPTIVAKLRDQVASLSVPARLLNAGAAECNFSSSQLRGK
jgi:hypothetical protein